MDGSQSVVVRPGLDCCHVAMVGDRTGTADGFITVAAGSALSSAARLNAVGASEA